MLRLMLAVAFVVSGTVAVAAGARAEATPEYHIVLENHKFEPATVRIPAGAQVKLTVTNRNSVPSEFESRDFNREKIVLPNSTITVLVGPLKKGSYKFFDDFHPATTGELIVE